MRKILLLAIIPLAYAISVACGQSSASKAPASAGVAHKSLKQTALEAPRAETSTCSGVSAGLYYAQYAAYGQPYPGLAPSSGFYHPYELYREARAMLNKDNYRKAAELFDEIAENYETTGIGYFPDALYWQAYALFRLGTDADLRKASALLEQHRAALDVQDKDCQEMYAKQKQETLAQLDKQRDDMAKTFPPQMKQNQDSYNDQIKMQERQFKESMQQQNEQLANLEEQRKQSAAQIEEQRRQFNVSYESQIAQMKVDFESQRSSEGMTREMRAAVDSQQKQQLAALQQQHAQELASIDQQLKQNQVSFDQQRRQQLSSMEQQKEQHQQSLAQMEEQRKQTQTQLEEQNRQSLASMDEQRKQTLSGADEQGKQVRKELAALYRLSLKLTERIAGKVARGPSPAPAKNS